MTNAATLRKHHRQKDGGKVKPINNWSKPTIKKVCFLDHANWKIMVKHSLPQVHPEASTGVFARHLLKND
jgi:hypothetical protein